MTVYPDEWVDITEELTLDCAQLKLGQLVHEPAFSLHEAMTAIEIMHPQVRISFYSPVQDNIKNPLSV